MSIATGFAPAELLELDGLFYDALAEAKANEWSRELELQAKAVELLSAMYRLLTMTLSKRGHHEQIIIERPAWAIRGADDAPPRMSISELARAFDVPRVEASRGE